MAGIYVKIGQQEVIVASPDVMFQVYKIVSFVVCCLLLLDLFGRTLVLKKKKIKLKKIKK